MKKIEECWYKDVCTNECSDGCLRFALMCALYNQSYVPESRQIKERLKVEPVDYDAMMELKDIQTHIDDFVKMGCQLYIWSGTCGNGKTSWALNMLWSYFDSIWHVSAFDCKGVFVNVQKFLYSCKRNISHPSNDYEIMCDRIESADIVIWDDITCAKSTDYEHQILFQYIDDRISQGKANIYTGNDSRESCVQKLGDKLTSRIWSGNVIELKGTDKRGYKYG